MNPLEEGDFMVDNKIVPSIFGFRDVSLYFSVLEYCF